MPGFFGRFSPSQGWWGALCCGRYAQLCCNLVGRRAARRAEAFFRAAVTIGVLANLDKPQAKEALQSVRRFAEKMGAQIALQTRRKGRLDQAFTVAQLKSMSLVVVLGGDGTVLSATRRVAPYRVPILPVHMGGFGFLAEIGPKDLSGALARFVEGDFHTVERMMLQVTAKGRKLSKIALNDAVLTAGPFARISRYQIAIGSKELATYPADGLIVSTPTGSTAYNLSAHGPIVDPSLSVYVVNPICAHTLFARPLILDARETVTIRFVLPSAPPVLTIDGQEWYRLREDDRLQVTQAPFRAALVRFSRRHFYDRLREKLSFGESGRAQGASS